MAGLQTATLEDNWKWPRKEHSAGSPLVILSRLVCQAVVNGLGPGDQVPAFLVLQFVTHFAFELLSGGEGARDLVFQGCLPEPLTGVFLDAREHIFDVQFVVTER